MLVPQERGERTTVEEAGSRFRSLLQSAQRPTHRFQHHDQGTTMAYECLLFEVKDHIATLTLNRPERLNALGGTLREDLIDAFSRVSRDDEVRAVVVTGAGRGFCSGGDVKNMGERDSVGASYTVMERIQPHRDAGVMAIRECPKPVIAAVNGPAAGAGFNLALCCDMRIASTAAKFSQAFVKRGLHPDWGGTWFLPRLVGTAKACELIFTGDTIDAQEAYRLGIVNAVVAPEELMGRSYDLAKKIASGPPLAIRLAKRAIYRNEGCGLREGLEFETYAQNICRDSEDSKEGVRAFLEKRTPNFTGR